MRTESAPVQPCGDAPRAAGWRRVLAPPIPLLALVILTTGYLAIHVLTLERSPLPWFDDTYFASVTDSVVRTGELRLLVSPLFFDKPVYMYGPVYFTITSLVAQLFPFDVFAFRFPCLLFSLGVAVLVGLILRRYKVPPAIAIVTVALVALDPTFYKSSHSGRMDSTVLFFILLSLLALPTRDRAGGGASIGRALLSGLAAGLAVLTTPRPAYLLVAIGCILAYRVARERSRERVIELAVWSGSVAVLYGIWFVHAFGSMGALLDYYGSVARDYLGGFWVRVVHVPVLAALLVLAVATRNAKRLSGELVFFIGAGIIGFYVLVREWGVLYSFFMIVPAYMGIGYLAAQLVARQRRVLPLVVLSSLLVVNTLAYVARNTFVIAQWAESDSQVVDQAVAAHIPKGSRVVGDDKYFFAVRKAGSEFQYISRGKTPEERVAYHRDVYRADYLITDLNEQSELLQEYVREIPLTKAGSIASPPPGAVARFLMSLANVFHFGPDTGYAPTVWARQGRSDHVVK